VAGRATPPHPGAHAVGRGARRGAGARGGGGGGEAPPPPRDSATIVIRPGADWAGHVPGQYLRVGIDVDGVRQWRAYSLTHGPRRDGRISITVKAVPDGVVSNHLVHEARPGTLVHLEQAAGEFVLPPEGGRFLFVTAGSGITPVIGMLRNLYPATDEGVLRPGRSAVHDIVVVHVAPSRPDSIFIRDLEALAEAGAIRLVARYDDEHGVLDVADLEGLVPDLRERRTLACGPSGLLDALAVHHDERGVELTTEQFRTARVEPGEGGTVAFAKAVRTNPRDWYWQETWQESWLKRSFRTADTLWPVGKRTSYAISSIQQTPGLPLEISASRFLRPHQSSRGILNDWRLSRVLNEMTRAARLGEVYHLWWQGFAAREPLDHRLDLRSP
jgi:stearoyl-CoA 9-desaturase NADPH oxidoreductase